MNVALLQVLNQGPQLAPLLLVLAGLLPSWPHEVLLARQLPIANAHLLQLLSKAAGRVLAPCATGKRRQLLHALRGWCSLLLPLALLLPPLLRPG